MRDHFNPKVPDVPGVRYYSVKTWAEPWTWKLSPLLYVPRWFIRGQSGELAQERNDGLVPFSSQAWGTVIGEFNMDHLGHINHHTFRPWDGDSSLAMYRVILKRLQQDGL